MILANFENGKVILDNLCCVEVEGDKKCHLSFDIMISNDKSSVKYSFGEIYYSHLYDLFDNKLDTITDETSYFEIGANTLIINKNNVSLSVYNIGFKSLISLTLNNFEDQEVLLNFLIEFKATVQTILED